MKDDDAGLSEEQTAHEVRAEVPDLRQLLCGIVPLERRLHRICHHVNPPSRA
jgi:hypothetical protein